MDQEYMLRLARRIKANPALFAELELAPSAYFRGMGQHVPVQGEQYFDTMIRKEFLPHIQDIDLNDLDASFGCWLCRCGVGLVAIAIVALGAAALTELTQGSAIVANLADVTGMSFEASLQFLKTLADIVIKGVAAVVASICEWTGACS